MDFEKSKEVAAEEMNEEKKVAETGAKPKAKAAADATADNGEGGGGGR